LDDKDANSKTKHVYILFMYENIIQLRLSV
jgi:hypothetical protein